MKKELVLFYKATFGTWSSEDVEREERNEVECSFDIDANLEFSYRPYSNFISMDSVSLSDIKTFIEHLHFKACA